MAGKNSRSSKTAHVLNLLSGGTPGGKAGRGAAPPGKHLPPPLWSLPPLLQTVRAEAPSSAARRLSPPILEVARSNNAAAVREHPHCAGILHFRRSWPPRSRLPPPLRPSCISRFRSGREKLLPRFWTLRPPLLLLRLLLLPLPLLPCRSRHPQSCQTAQSSSM